MKDPAFLFYSADYLVGVLGMSFEDQGKYMSILATMHQKGRLKEETIRFLVGSVSEELKSKFLIDGDGKWYSKRLETEIQNRIKFTESRRANGRRGGRPPKSTDEVNPTLPDDSGGQTNLHFTFNDKTENKPNEKPNGFNLAYANDNLTINVNEIINEIEKIENKNLAEKILELFKTKNWRHKNISALNETIKKCLKYHPDFIIKQIENAIIGEWNGLFYDNTDSEYKKFISSNQNQTKKSKPNIDNIKYGSN